MSADILHCRPTLSQCSTAVKHALLWDRPANPMGIAKFGGQNPKTPAPIDKKIGVGNYVGNSSSQAEIQNDRFIGGVAAYAINITLEGFFARDVIYISRAYVTMSVSVCLSVCLWRLCIEVTRCNGSQIPLHALIDGCLCNFTDNASPGSSDGTMPGYLVEKGWGHLCDPKFWSCLEAKAKKGVDRRFQAKRTKYLNFYIIKTTMWLQPNFAQW